MQIFTFWEPAGQMPGYLQLCMKTWKKLIPDAKITLIDYSNIKEYIDIDFYGKKLFDGLFSLPQIADAVRCMLLEKYGGLWLDADTIILSSDFVNYFTSTKDITLFGSSKNRTCSIACIHASKPHSPFMKQWVNTCRKKY